ncbi:phage virion morphogenesis protein [Halomonas sp. NO4]|uniref:phage tail protein n=1 Tax=Halomonas sp. NO4 TaxID=2484813 RepID=UPI0013D61A2F|nr:phage virion morphogenesis protein [Halomonas sp. NO4]
MNKLQSLRAHMLGAVPELKRGPERLLTFVQDGIIRFHRGRHLSHEYRVDAQLVVTDFSGSLEGAEVGFVGRVTRIARVHQKGLRAKVDRDGPRVDSPERILVGFSAEDHRLFQDSVLQHLDVPEG